MRLYLASTSPARLAVLRAAGIEPVVRSSGVGERAVIAAIEAERGPLTAAEMVVTLAEAKAEAVAARAADGGADYGGADHGSIGGRANSGPSARTRDRGPGYGAPDDDARGYGAPDDDGPDSAPDSGPGSGAPDSGPGSGATGYGAPGYGGPGSGGPDSGGSNREPHAGVLDGFILGGDSVFEFDGRIYGKPHTAEVARARWQRQRGGEGILWSGLCLIDHRGGVPHGRSSGVDSATVRFESEISDREIDAYIATGEPLNVAGAFTIDSLGAPLVAAISGAPSTVVGLSIPLLRRMLRDDFGVDWPTLWNH